MKNKKMLIAIISGILIIIAIITIIAVMSKNNSNNDTNVGNNESICRHVDANNDNVCDKCGNIIDPNKVVETYITDTDAAAKIFNNMISKIQSKTYAVDLSNISFTGSLAEEMDLSSLSDLEITMDNQVIAINQVINNMNREQYIVFDKNNAFVIQNEDNNYTHSIINGLVIDNINLEYVKAENLNYKDYYFIIDSNYLTNIMNQYMNNFRTSMEYFEEELEMQGLTDVYENAQYNGKFSLNKHGEIEELIIEGINNIQGSKQTVFKLTMSYKSTILTIDISMNMDLALKTTIVLDPIEGSSTNYDFKIDFEVIPPSGMGTENLILYFTSTLTKSNRTLVIPEAISQIIEEVSKEINMKDNIATKYAGLFTIEDDYCDNYVIYDEEYDVFVYFDYNDVIDSDQDFYQFVEFSENKTNDACIVSIDFDKKTMVVVEHSNFEQSKDEFAILYNGIFTTNADSSYVSIYNEDRELYVYFEFNVNKNGFVYYGCGYNSKSYTHAQGTIDIDKKEIIITSYAMRKQIDSLYKDLVCTVEGYLGNSDCGCINICVYSESFGVYLLFHHQADGTLKFVNSIYTPVGCIGTFDENNNHIIITEHSYVPAWNQ